MSIIINFFKNMKKFIKFSYIFLFICSFLMIFSGIFGVLFTYKTVAREKIVTPEDASMPNKKVSEPLTLKSQMDIIRHHTLQITSDKTFAQMDRFVSKKDSAGNVILDSSGKPEMVENTARNIWITATALITALGLAILSYALSLFSIVCGILFLIVAVVLRFIEKRF